MKKDFSQPLRVSDELHYYLLIQNSVTGKFLIFRSKDPFEDGWANTLGVGISKDRQLGLELTNYLYGKGLVLNTYRELVSQSSITFSFVDETPGSEKTEVCMLVSVDVTADAQLENSNVRAEFVDLEEIAPIFSESPFFPAVFGLGVARLQAESR